MEKRFILQARAIQVKEGKTDAEFSEGIGISRMHWHRLVTGQNRAGRKVLLKLMSAYPEELGRQIKEYLSSLDRISTKAHTGQADVGPFIRFLNKLSGGLSWKLRKALGISKS